MFGAKQKIDTDERKIDELLSRGVIVDVLPTKSEFRKKLLSGERLKFYIGFDPTANTLHLSHAKNLILLEEFRKLGHEVTVLFGDFTARIGDPSGRSDARRQLSSEEISDNVRLWKKQILPIMDFNDRRNPPLIKYNNTWLSTLNFADVIKLAAEITVQQMLERDMFAKRIREEKPIHLHEFLYPLMQGYDSVAMGVDVEMCGTDQTFNALMGRTLVKKILGKEKFVVVVNLMENPKTGELMSKSKGTGVFLNTDANQMFGEVMAQPDEIMKPLFVNITRLPLSEIDGLITTNHPKEAKLALAEKITEIFHGSTAATRAKENFEKTFSQGGLPEEIKEIKRTGSIRNTIVGARIISSNSEFTRLVQQGAVSNLTTGEKITDPNSEVSSGTVLKIGKHTFVKIV